MGKLWEISPGQQDSLCRFPWCHLWADRRGFSSHSEPPCPSQMGRRQRVFLVSAALQLLSARRKSYTKVARFKDGVLLHFMTMYLSQSICLSFLLFRELNVKIQFCSLQILLLLAIMISHPLESGYFQPTLRLFGGIMRSEQNRKGYSEKHL